MQLENLHQLFVNELRELYSGEKQISDALPRMAKAATSRDLRRAFKDHLKETEEHVSRLEKSSSSLVSPAGKATVMPSKGSFGLAKT
jgi:ferritin-like metal-binding protein YciE